MVKVSIIGATGYVGLELTRLLAAHPEAEIVRLSSQSYAGQRMEDIYPSFKGRLSMEIAAMEPETIARQSDVVFCALPHGASGGVAPLLAATGAKIIDMSGDFRYDSPAVYERWYGLPQPAPEIAPDFVFGLPELHRERIRAARFVANPGCYPTASILALAPLLAGKCVEHGGIIIDAKSGVTGAGRKPSQANHFPETADNFKAYNAVAHRHVSEIEQELSKQAGTEVMVGFTPHLLPVKRGILATCHASLMPGVDAARIEKTYADFYAGEPFITLLPSGELPELKHVVGSNQAAIGFAVDARMGRLVVVSCIDNLIKGAAGQGVQNMNLLFGLPEDRGLDAPAWYL